MILVAGGTGFVGTKVVHALRAADLPVRVLAASQKQEQLRAWGCEVVQGDMTDADSLRRAARAATRSCTSSPSCWEPRRLRAGHGAGTRDLVEAAKEAGAKRLVLASALGTEEGET